MASTRLERRIEKGAINENTHGKRPASPVSQNFKIYTLLQSTQTGSSGRVLFVISANKEEVTQRVYLRVSFVKKLVSGKVQARHSRQKKGHQHDS